MGSLYFSRGPLVFLNYLSIIIWLKYFYSKKEIGSNSSFPIPKNASGFPISN